MSAGNNWSRPLLTLTFRLSCLPHRQVDLAQRCSGVQFWGSVGLLGAVVTPAQKRITHVLCCKSLLGSPSELCLPYGTKQVWDLKWCLWASRAILSVSRWHALGRARTCKYTPQAANRTGKWTSTRKQKNLLMLSCDWREILFAQSHVPSKTNPTVLHFDLYQELLAPLQEKIHLLYSVSSWLQFTHVLNVPLDSSNIL